MPYLLNLIYFVLLVVASPWLVYAAVRHGKYREGYAAKLLGRVPIRPPAARGDTGRCVWLHAVSVGEVNLLQPLLDELHRRHPEWVCVVSTTTKTGYDLARSRYPELSVFYCPLDFSWAVRTAMRRVRPDLLVLAELELWPNLVRAARERGARVAIVNGRLSDHSFCGYRRIRSLVGRLLGQIDLVIAQSDEIAERFLALGCRRATIHVTGSLKFDGTQTDRHNPLTTRLRRLIDFVDEDVVFLAGSTQHPEDSLALDAYQQLVARYPRLRLVLVPRHPQRFDAVAQMLAERGVPFVRRSQLHDDQHSSHSDAIPPRPVLLVDAIGELGGWWGTASIGFVGGSLGSRGGQNMIEPAAYGVAVSFGPNTSNFRDVVAALRAADAAEVVADGRELTAFVRRCLEEPRFAADLGARARTFVKSQLGATDRTVSLLESLFSSREQSPQAARPAA